MYRQIVQLDRPMTGITIGSLQASTAGTGKRQLTESEQEDLRREALMAQSQQVKEVIGGIQESLDEIEQRRAQSLDELQQIAIELAIIAAEHIVACQIQEGAFGIETLVRQAVDRLGMNEAATLHLHPEDLQLLGQHMADLRTAFHPRQLQLHANPGLDRGTVRIAGEAGRVVMSTIANRLAEVRDSWMENLHDAQTERRDVPTDAQTMRRYPDRRETA